MCVCERAEWERGRERGGVKSGNALLVFALAPCFALGRDKVRFLGFNNGLKNERDT